MQNQREFVDIACICRINHCVRRNVTHMRNLALQSGTQWLFASTHDDVGLNSSRAQLCHAVLRGLCLLLPAWANKRHQGHMQITHIVTSGFVAELTDGLEEGQNLNVAHCSAHFRDDNICVLSRDALNAAFDFIGDVRNDLHCLSEIITTTFCSQNSLVNTASGGI